MMPMTFLRSAVLTLFCIGPTWACGESGDSPESGSSDTGGSLGDGDGSADGGAPSGSAGTGGSSASGGGLPIGTGGAPCPEGYIEGPVTCELDHDVSCPLEGLAFGYLIEEGEVPGTPLTRELALERLALISDTTRAIRTYGCLNDREVARAAKELGLEISMGAYLTADDTANAAELQCLIEVCNQGYCDTAIVGNEFEISGASPEQIVAGIEEVRAKIDDDIPITTAVILGSYAEYPSLAAAVDELYVHIYPSLARYPVEHAMTYMHDAYERVRAVAGEKPIVISETGWPSSGGLSPGAYGAVVFNPADAAEYLKSFVSWAETELRPQDSYFYFESTDEPWKDAFEPSYGAHWGITTQGVLKPGIHATLDCERSAPSWGNVRIPDANTVGLADISVTEVPGLDTADPICGTTNFLVPADHHVLVYVNTEFGWWGPKSFGDSALVMSDGTWCSEYASPGTADEAGTDIAVFLTSETFDAPIVSGPVALPQTLADNAVDYEIVAR